MKKISRRTFARTAMVATAAAALPNAIAQTQPPAPKPAPAEPKPPSGAPALSPPAQAEVDARVQWIFTKYGSRLSDEQRADIRRIIAAGQSGVEDMRKYALDNGASPAPAFRPYRKAVKK